MGYPFDDDEESPPIGFEQDPESDDLGEGYWTRADGSRVYSRGDPEVAKQLMDRAPAGTDPLKLPNPNPLTSEEKASVTAATTATPEEVEALGGASPEPAGEPTTDTPDALTSEFSPEAAQKPQPAPMQQRSPLQAPALPGASGPARYTDTTGASASRSESSSRQESVSRQGSAQDRGEFERQQQDVAGSYDRANQSIEEGNAGLVKSLLERKAALMQMGADKEAATAGAIAQRDARANQVKTKMQDVASRKTDHNKIWKDKGIAGTALGLLGVALRSLHATKFGGPNTALQSLQEQRKQNIQAQMEDRDSELRGLERELGSLDAAVPMLEARMRDAENKRIEAMLVDEKSAAVIANGKQMIAQNNVERDKYLAESAKAYAGTIAQQQSQGTQQSATEGVETGRSRLSGAGVGDGPKGKTRGEMYDDLLERDKKMEERGVPKEERAKMWEGYGFNAPSGESAPSITNREQQEKVARDEATFTEDQAKAESAMATLGEYGNVAGLKRDPKTGKWAEPGGFGGTVSAGWEEGFKETFGQSTPVGDARAAAGEALGRLASGGVITKEEEERFRTMLGEAKSRNQLASKLNTIEVLVNVRRKSNRREAPRGAPSSWRSKGASP